MDRARNKPVKSGTRIASIANLRPQQATKEARKLKRAAQKESEDITFAAEETLYGPGIAD